MPRVALICAKDNILVISIDEEIYYLDLRQIIPDVYNANLIKQTIANFDTWIVHKTGYRYSERALRDIADAYTIGVSNAYSAADMEKYTTEVVKTTLQIIYNEDMTSELDKLFNIEAGGVSKIDDTLSKIRDRFEEFKIKSPDVLYGHLCRMLTICRKKQTRLVPLIERFIERLDRAPADPDYSFVDGTAAMIAHSVLKTRSKIPTFKNCDKEILKNVNRLTA